jgi:PPOX class probable F420-dependent enzyme
MALSEEKYLLLTTFRRNGTAVPTPIWAVPLEGGSIGFWTSSGSGKAKRLAHTSRVTVQPCDARGKVKAGTSPTEATARFATDAEYRTIGEKVRAKYGFMTKVTKVLAMIGGIAKRKRIPYGDRAVVITVS